MLTGSHGQGDKTLDANVKAAVGVQRLIPPDLAHWADVHHRADGAVRESLVAAELLAVA